MTFNILMDKIFVDLKILAKLPQNGKLNTIYNNQLYLENDSMFQGIYRFLKGDSRNKTIEKIEDLINTAKQIANSLLQSSSMNIYEKNTSPSKFEISEFNKNFQQLKSLSNELKNSQKGINNLRVTYQNDTYVVSKLEVILENIKRLVVEIESGIENKLPKENQLNKYLSNTTRSVSDDNYSENFEVETQIEHN
jgi:hypothetical protein